MKRTRIVWSSGIPVLPSGTLVERTAKGTVVKEYVYDAGSEEPDAAFNAVDTDTTYCVPFANTPAGRNVNDDGGDPVDHERFPGTLGEIEKAERIVPVSRGALNET